MHRQGPLAFSSLALACIIAVLGSTPATANLIVNESFESGPDPGAVMPLAVGSTAVTGWQVTRDPIDYSGTQWNAMQGTRSIALNGTSPGGIAQTFATFPSGTYTVSYYMAGDAFSNPILKHMRVTAAGQFQDETFDASHAWPWGMGWLEKTFIFTANSTSTTLEFYSLDAGDTGPTLDQVVVQLTSPAGVDLGPPGRLALGPPVPSPSTGPFRIEYAVPVEAPARLSVCDVQGREVAVLADGPQTAGRHASSWDGRIAGRPAAAGVYYVYLSAPGASVARKAVITQ